MKKDKLIQEKSLRKDYSYPIWYFIILVAIISWLGSYLEWKWVTRDDIIVWILWVLYIIWKIIQRPLMVIWGLIIIYGIVKFIKRAWYNWEWE